MRNILINNILLIDSRPINVKEVVLNNIPLMSIKKIAENKPKNFKNYDFKNNKNFKKAN